MSDRYIESGAIVSGWPAVAISKLLDRQCRQQIEELPDHLRLPIEEAADAIRAAGKAWAAAYGGTAEPVAADPVPSKHELDLSTDGAARMLGLSARRVRELAQAGRIPARRIGGRWVFDRAEVQAHTENGGNGND